MAKRALITSGGGAKGAFTVGALQHLATINIRHFDIISGTSTGSLIAAMAAVEKIGVLATEYTNVTNDNILTKNNIINNVTQQNKAFIFDTLPLLNLIKKHITQEVFDTLNQPNATTLCLTAISLQTGKPTVFSNKDIPAPADGSYNTFKVRNLKELQQALLASSSQAGFLPPVKINGEQFVDGGNREVIPTRIVVDLQPDEIFVLSNNPGKIFEVEGDIKDILNVVLRAISIFIQDVRENDLRVLKEYCDRKNIRPFIIEPAEDLDPDNPTGLRFNPLTMSLWMAQGILKARQVVGA
jgi:predicted acylesterase/phospholipase RssA